MLGVQQTAWGIMGGEDGVTIVRKQIRSDLNEELFVSENNWCTYYCKRVRYALANLRKIANCQVSINKMSLLQVY